MKPKTRLFPDPEDLPMMRYHGDVMVDNEGPIDLSIKRSSPDTSLSGKRSSPDTSVPLNLTNHSVKSSKLFYNNFQNDGHHIQVTSHHLTLHNNHRNYHHDSHLLHHRSAHPSMRIEDEEDEEDEDNLPSSSPSSASHSITASSLHHHGHRILHHHHHPFINECSFNLLPNLMSLPVCLEISANGRVNSVKSSSSSSAAAAAAMAAVMADNANLSGNSDHHRSISNGSSKEGGRGEAITPTTSPTSSSTGVTIAASTTDKKRLNRPLTGRHVRHGTGASAQTLVKLRIMLQKRRRETNRGSNSTSYRRKAK